jgi:Cytochrome bd-type quinol oxidase, subunit 2
MTGVAVPCGYALLGACWLLIKTEGHLQAWARRSAVRLLVAMLGFIALVSLWTPLAEARRERERVVDPASVVYIMNIRLKQESVHHADRAYFY